jgi:hypothetical protein
LVAKSAVGPRRGKILGSVWGLEKFGKGIHGLPGVEQADVAVDVHGQPGIGVAGQRLDGLDRRPGLRQGGDVAVPETVKVHDAAGAILIRYAAPLQVELEHHPGPLRWDGREHGTASRLAGKPGAERGHQGLGQGLLGLLAVLGVPGLADDHGGLIIEPERLGGQRQHLVTPQSAHGRDPVEHRAVHATNLPPGRGGPGRLDQGPQLRHR